MTTLQTLWVGVGLGLTALVTIAGLRGAFGLAAALSRKFAHEGGESWTVAAVAEPLIAIVVALVVPMFGLAHPESWWARTFYSEDQMTKAGERYSEC